jgi:hypothetical protein
MQTSYSSLRGDYMAERARGWTDMTAGKRESEALPGL